jgi:hypothetical protein
LAIAAGFLLQTAAIASDKKGIGLADLHDVQRLQALHVSWYYTWRPHPIEGADPSFVPMVWGGKRGPIDGTVPVLFGFNEPDNAQQSALSVADAIGRWPELEEHAARLGSPAVANLDDGWLDQFMAHAERQHLRVDFIALHLYGPPKPEWFLKRIGEVHDKYHRPIWITEFAVADWSARGRPGANRFSEAQVLDCMKVLLPELEKRPYVERYAWFGAGELSQVNEQVRTSRLFEADGSLTELGRYYAQF